MTPRRSLAALALVFALAHVPFLAASLEDIDSVNFALGVRDFNVAEHRPHPPGYPVYIALGKTATAIVGALDSRAAAVARRKRVPSRFCRCSRVLSRSPASTACSRA